MASGGSAGRLVEKVVGFHLLYFPCRYLLRAEKRM